MLSDEAVRFLQPLKYDPSAHLGVSVVPLGGIFWSDEIPDSRQLNELPEVERDQIYRLFSIRFELWAGRALEPDDQRFWDEAKEQVHEYPLFRRLVLSRRERVNQKLVERCILRFYSRANQIELDGEGGITATFKIE